MLISRSPPTSGFPPVNLILGSVNVSVRAVGQGEHQRHLGLSVEGIQQCVVCIERCQLAGDDGSTGRTANLVVWPTTARFSMPFLQLQLDSGHHGHGKTRPP